MLRFDIDTLLFEDFGIEIDKSDFILNGSLANVFYTLLNVEKEIYGNLNISSATYDFPDFFKYDLRVANNFPYRIKDIDLNVNVRTSTSKLSEFIMAPEIEIDIQQLKAEIEDFLPPVNINSGIFKLGDQDSSLNLDFSDFDIEMAGSKLLADVIFNSPREDPDWLKVDVEASNINPQKIFLHWFSDSLSDYLNARLDGEMHLDLILSSDTIDFDKLDFTADNLKFVNSIDTFDVSQMRIDALDVNYNLKSSSNILKYLDAKIDLTINKIFSNHFNVDDLDYKIDVEKGEFYIHPRKYQFFNQMGEGSYVLRPFEKIPSYEIKYKVQQFDVGYLFSTFLKDTILSGKMDLDIDIKFEGTETDMIKKTLNGKLIFSGKDLTFYGLDLDKVIDRFKRSQHFTFADVGAVLLMGPAGILVTKGSDFASIVVLNPGESSRVLQLSSEWALQDGIVNLSDVAFTTDKNRMAAKGWINIATDSLDIDIALLNESGCSLYSQGISGSRKDPDIGKVKVMKSIFAPVTNLVKGDCEVFYDGKVKQPAKK